MFLLTEILNTLPSKYKVKATIPSQIYYCTLFDLQRYIGIDKFSKISDPDYFVSSDKDILRHHLEKISWDEYKTNMYQRQLDLNSKDQYYLNSKNRDGTSQSWVKRAKIDPKTDAYFRNKFSLTIKEPAVNFNSRKSSMDQ